MNSENHNTKNKDASATKDPVTNPFKSANPDHAENKKDMGSRPAAEPNLDQKDEKHEKHTKGSCCH